MKTALIGHSGFVGSSLARQTSFDARYRSTDIQDIRGKHFDLLVCAGASGKKWLANREPANDLRSLETLMSHLEHVRSDRVVLISTVDVFSVPVDVDERTPVGETGLQPYGLHRRMLEQFTAARFPRSLVVRLPGLVGPGLRKNVLFDLHNHKDLSAVDGRAEFQFYPMVNLWQDLARGLSAGLELLHLCAEPVSVTEVALEGFGRDFGQAPGGPIPRYDLRTVHAPALGGEGPYTYSRRESLLAIRAYAQSEPRGEQP